ncbi:ATP-binding protein [Altererythrobacter sp. B11]|uniref:ATP-binding protein n=1 Tax=Altererythrobacter sp. B11 TaxID=2060312 RepID=UPI000DC6D832|nr:ATP-binding protein [Altererythrobacter sp. B11]BBC72560.1 ATP-binding protein [Altererythrobacter sp. B11]
MDSRIEIGTDERGAPVVIDVEELLATRLLVQGNSGSGKSHLLRRLLEESAPLVQQVVIDPEGDFVSLGEEFGHVVVDGAAYADGEITRLATRIREHRASVVLALDGLEIDGQMRCAATFLAALFDAPREHWYPALVTVDEAQLFAPAAAGEVSEEARRLSLGAMTNLMCRGRKRGLAGVIATQRLAKLAKNVAAEASNFLMGRTFLDIDMVRAADLLGMERRQAERIRDLERGRFLGLGPAISRRPVAVKIGAVRTKGNSVAAGLMPLPTASAEEMGVLLHDGLAEAAALPPPPPPPTPVVDAGALQDRIATFTPPQPSHIPPPPAPPADSEPLLREVLAEMAGEEGCTFQPQAALYQDFSVRCRMKGLPGNALDASQFARRFAIAVAGVDTESAECADMLALASSLPEDVVAPFLAIARSAAEGEPCPEDDELARIYGTSSPRRVQRLLDHFEKQGLLVVRTDFGGRRTVTIPHLNLTTAAV